jgi:hypothetical protein
MKKIMFLLVASMLLIVTTVMAPSCTKPGGCDGTKGTLELTNSSLFTVQRIMINGVSYGTLDAGDSKSIDLSPGMYSWQLVGISGGSGCSAAAVTITACDTQAYKCSGK